MFLEMTVSCGTLLRFLVVTHNNVWPELQLLIKRRLLLLIRSAIHFFLSEYDFHGTARYFEQDYLAQDVTPPLPVLRWCQSKPG